MTSPVLPLRRATALRPLGLLALLLALPSGLLAQDTPARPPSRPAEVRVQVGWAAFVDESLIDHVVAGASARVYLSPRVSVEPELTWMRGPGQDRDLVLLGNVVFDLIRRPARVSPYLVAGAGLLRHSNGNGPVTWSGTAVHVGGGPGMTVAITSRTGAFAEWRFGWEPFTRVTAGLAHRWGDWQAR
jgi:hypothetical protein